MTWRKTEGGWNNHPYQIRWLNGGRWLARCNQGQSMPENLGTYETQQEARAACEGHRKAIAEEWQSAGLGEK
jgi:hypothetical protein